MYSGHCRVATSSCNGSSADMRDWMTIATLPMTSMVSKMIRLILQLTVFFLILAFYFRFMCQNKLIFYQLSNLRVFHFHFLQTVIRNRNNSAGYTWMTFVLQFNCCKSVYRPIRGLLVGYNKHLYSPQRQKTDKLCTKKSKTDEKEKETTTT